jgi:hypothetical protein
VTDDDDEGFVSRIAHELRTPLAVVMGYAQLLPMRGDDAEFRRQAVVHIEEAVARLSTAVGAVILSTAVDAGELRLDRQPHDLGDLLAAVARNRDVVLECRDASGWPRVSADRQYVTTMFELLLGGDAGGGRISAETVGDLAAITVATDGRGPSTLGVYAARRLAELHGGTFEPAGPTLTLPLAPP